jgi:hypothetical protein
MEKFSQKYLFRKKLREFFSFGFQSSLKTTVPSVLEALETEALGQKPSAGFLVTSYF